MTECNYKISDMLTFSHRDEIIEELLFQIGIQEGEFGVTAVITDYDLAVTVFDELCKKDGILVRRAILDHSTRDEIFVVAYEYDTGVLSIQPACDCDIIDDIDLAYVDMDGAVSHKFIETLPSESTVILFGEEDNFKDKYESNLASLKDFSDKETDDNLHGFTVTIDNENGRNTHISYYGTENFDADELVCILSKFGVIKDV